MKFLRAHTEILGARGELATVENVCADVLTNLPGETWAYGLLIRSLIAQGKVAQAEDFRRQSALDLCTVAESFVEDHSPAEAEKCLRTAVELEPKVKKAILANPLLAPIWKGERT
jgi:hypothetical protein